MGLLEALGRGLSRRIMILGLVFSGVKGQD
jgi:hypothetical protein